MQNMQTINAEQRLKARDTKNMKLRRVVQRIQNRSFRFTNLQTGCAQPSQPVQILTKFE
jgi:hypothetical protein